MDSTTSVSKGVFLFKNGFKKSKQAKKKYQHSLFEALFISEPWYIAFHKNWLSIEDELKDLHQKTYSVLLNEIVQYVKLFSHNNNFDGLDGVIPSATLLTGVNQPDHVNQFTTLVSMIREEITPHVAMIHAQDASSVKHVVENVVWQLIHEDNKMPKDVYCWTKAPIQRLPLRTALGRPHPAIQLLPTTITSLSDQLDTFNDSLEDNSGLKKLKLKRNQCTLKVLQKWYQDKYKNSSPKKKSSIQPTKSLVIIIPDFESFNCNILQDFVMIISSYISTLPIIFIFGVATSVSALHKSFPYHVSSKLLIKVFQSHASHVYMNQVIENIFLTHTSPFHLSGKALELLTDVFLFYDFSVMGLIQSLKYCMMDHHYGDNTKSLCCDRDNIEKAVMNLSSDDIESLRQLLSFRPFLEVQECQTKISLFKDNSFFKEVLYQEMNKLHDYMYSFYVCVRLLTVFVTDLPKNILGKSVREIYTKCAMEHVTKTQAFKECMQLLNFQSQLKLVETIKNALKVVNSSLKNVSPVKPLSSTPMKNNINNIILDNDLGESFIKTVRVHFLTFLRQIENANNEPTVFINKENDDNDMENIPGNRYKLKEKLLKATRVDRIQSEFEMIRARFTSYLEEMFSKGLLPPHTQTFHEILFFNEVINVKKQIVGSPRGALHMALSNPVHYLQCSCCHLPSIESVSDTLPDLCLVYKLHRECGKHINLYDWLQAFGAVLRPDDEDEQRHQDASVQVRFTRAVAELQFLGFIKSSKRKTDHVMRLTW